MVLKRFIRNDKVDPVEQSQCHDECPKTQFIVIETQQYSVRMLVTCRNTGQRFTNKSLWLFIIL